jgi:Myb/SANT-like DNA-binding domain
MTRRQSIVRSCWLTQAGRAHIVTRAMAKRKADSPERPQFIRKHRFTWDSIRDRFLCRYLAKIKQNGRQGDNGFKIQIWKDLQWAFNEKFNVSIVTSQIQTRMQAVLLFSSKKTDFQLKAMYTCFIEVKNQSGFGWDQEQQVPTAPDAVWDAYILKHPKAAVYHTKTFENYEELEYIYGSTFTGDYAENTVRMFHFDS